MKSVIITLIAVFTFGHFASASGVITVIGRISKATETRCPMRTFQYYVQGDFRTASGAIGNFGACLESVAIPLFESLDNPIRPTSESSIASVNRTIDAENILAKNTGRILKMKFFVDDPELLKSGLGTLLSIEETKK